MSRDYREFLETKEVRAPVRGLADVPPLAPHLFRFQRECVDFGLRVGSWGLFLDTGLGKTACELEWSKHAAAASNGYALILTPLAVARQIEREGARWGYDARVIREQAEARPGINICNYDRLDKLDPDAFGAVALDESSILKQFTGKTSRFLINAFAGHRWRMAATATPAPNDHMELGQHAEFLGIMSSAEMLTRWFINDSGDASHTWRLKKHAEHSFWDWMSSWARMAEHPRDLGDDIDGFDLPALNIHRVDIANDLAVKMPGELFGGLAMSATSMHQVKRQTSEARAAEVARLVTAEPGEGWVVWCDTDYEADALKRSLAMMNGDLREVRGSHSIEEKEAALVDFSEGRARVIVTKPSIAGHGLNWQHVARMIFVGRTFSYESWYQAVRRSWRYGQKRLLDVYLIVASGEDAIGRVIARKEGDHKRTKREMREAMKRALGHQSLVRLAYVPKHSAYLPAWIGGEK